MSAQIVGRARRSVVAQVLEPRHLLGAGPNAVLIPDVPSYEWYYGCAPTAIGMILGYWDAHGAPDLFEGSAATQTPAVNEILAGVAHRVAGQENRPTDFDGHYDGWGDYRNSRSYPSHEMNPASLADFLKTADGAASRADFVAGTARHLAWRGYYGWNLQRKLWGQYSFADIRGAIDAGRPLLASVDTDGDASADHAVTIVGYDPVAGEYAALNTWDEALAWYIFAPMAAGTPWGLESIWNIYPGSPVADQSPYYGTPTVLPVTIQAEDFDLGADGAAYHDTSAGNSGGKYRTTGVDIETTTDAGAGRNVGWIIAGEWLEYSVDVPVGGTYTIEARVASPKQGGTFHVQIDGVNVTGTLAIPNTGGWQTWQTLAKPPVQIGAGQHVVRIAFDSNGATGFVGNLNWINFTPYQQPIQTPFGGTPIAIAPTGTATIPAEDFDNGGEGVAYHDTDAANLGGAYRTTGVDIQATTDAGAGHNVGWTKAGEWLEYTIDVAEAGTFTLEIRVACPSQGGKFHVEFDGVNRTGTLSVPNTGGWQTWRTISTSVSLAAGRQVMRIAFDANSSAGFVGNFNWMKLTRAGDPVSLAAAPLAAPRFTSTVLGLLTDEPGDIYGLQALGSRT
jgi:hypothetical protein